MTANGRLTGKTVLVTGAARGIGLCCARMMALQGASVALADIDHEAVELAAGAVASETRRPAIAIPLDVADAAGWQLAVADTERELGGLNVLVNNAGICIPGTVEELDEADWDRTMAVDLKSVFLGCRTALPVMARYAPGAIVNISSISGLVAGHNMAAYNAAKAGVHMLTKSVALHAARKGYDIRANSVHPAFVDTGMVDEVVGGSDPRAARAKLARQIPLGTIGLPEDVGHAVVYLASDEARFMTGAEIKLDGGLSAM
ncbi:MAG TPA: glucose 1-dehydrogenase [Longimicrobiales bacterium]|nr:glucose 1-dehydrogenase [Longimicrobiales bacterium]